MVRFLDRMIISCQKCYSTQFLLSHIYDLHSIHTVPPNSPTGLFNSYVDNSSISINWTNGFDGYSPLVGINISYTSDRYPQDGTTERALPLGTAATLSNLHPYSNYYINVSLTNAVGLTSNPSNISVATLSLSESESHVLECCHSYHLI